MLPNGLKLDRREVRGEVSDGMILAEDEVGLGTDHDGIMLLPETEPGTPLGDVLPLVDAVLHVESTGNRPDLQSVYGLAREIAALYDLELPPAGRPARGRAVPTARSRSASTTTSGCPRYIGRLFEDVDDRPVADVAARAAERRRPAPDLERRRHHQLRDARPRQPAARVRLPEARRRPDRRAPRGAGRAAAHARQRRRELVPDDLLIADAERGVALAGIMGGEETEIGDGTTTVLLEAANFEPHGIYRSSERQRMRTEGSNRWEKGVDPYLAEPAADLATRLMLELAGGRWTAARTSTPSCPCRRRSTSGPSAPTR